MQLTSNIVQGNIVAQDLAGLTDIAQLLGQFEQSYLALDYFVFTRHF